MKYNKINNFEIALNVNGSDQYTKVSYPIRYGVYSEIKTKDYIYQFNQNGEIRYITGKNGNWPNPLEWLKRTVANDWVYYSSGGYAGLYSIIGEHYYPCFSYSSNSLLRSNPFENESVKDSINSIEDLLEEITEIKNNPLIDNETSLFLEKIVQYNKKTCALKSHKFHTIIGGRVSVLPPDSRHVDYDVIPVIISDGCLYNCGFCSVKSGQEFCEREPDSIIDQIDNLKEFYGEDISNYNSLFIGQHDALYAKTDLIEHTAKYAYERFGFKESNMRNSKIFMFGSVESILNKTDADFKRINSLPFYTYINVGLESFDQETLDFLKKPLQKKLVEKAFLRMVEINRMFPNIEVTSNFIYGSNLPENHYSSIMELLREKVKRKYNKGDVYFSYFNDGGDKGKMQREFYNIKNSSNLPAYTYLIQRL
ncbi:MAG: radical SAM protein [Desulfobacterales bacterium]|nr:radical SAM protein [Desulfobacterales bacterium]MCP4163521.1 radical SAM protein [Deltaproteobacteria bacterium]